MLVEQSDLRGRRLVGRCHCQRGIDVAQGASVIEPSPSLMAAADTGGGAAELLVQSRQSLPK